MGTKQNLVIDQGTSFQSVLNYRDDNQDPINLTGYTGAGQIRKHYSSSNSTSFTITLGGANGTVTLALSANTTANLVSGRYVYDIEITNGSGLVSRIFEGIVTVTPQVTR